MSTIDPAPLPDHDPRALLEALMVRFSKADGPHDPARALLSVAGPRFASGAGDARHLAHLFGNPAWAPLLGHAAAEVGEIEVVDAAARATIRVRTADGTTVSYLASLRRDDRRENGRPCWQVTGLVRSELAGS